MRTLALLSLLLLLAFATSAVGQTPVGTAFTYQGQLILSNVAVDEPTDFLFTLYDAASGGNVVGSTQDFSAVDVSLGAFTVELDFGASVFSGDRRWLQIHVRTPAGAGGYQVLSPRQEITAVPYALHALSAPGGGGGSGQWQLVGSAITNTNSGFVGINGTSPLSSAEVFGVRSPATSSYGGMYVSTAGSQAIPFYGFDAGGLRAWMELDGSDSTWKLYNNGYRLALKNNGYMGIGTMTPQSKLEVAGTIHSTTGGFKFPDGSIQTSAATGGGGGNDGDWQLNGADMYNLNSDQVTIGGTSPATGAKLTVTGGDYGFTLLDVNGTLGGQLNVRGPAETLQILTGNGQSQIKTLSNANLSLIAGGDLKLTALGMSDFYADGQQIARMQSGATEFLHSNGNTTVLIDGEGPTNFGGLIELSKANGLTTMKLDGAGGSGAQGAAISLYNDTNPNDATVVLDGEYGGAAGGALLLRNSNGANSIELAADLNPGERGMIRMYQPDGTRTIEIDSEETGDPTQGGSIKLYDDSGNKTIELDGDYGTSNEGRIITQVIEITGGSDLSEQFDILGASVEDIQPGSVVSIDPDSPGGLRLSASAYDRRVAGVVSGAEGVRPGLLMGQRGTAADGQHPVALTGRVYCRVDASFGAIEPGDLLTTSPTRGCAMKVTEHDRAQGAILGKAMTALESGQGTVLVLVSLQ